MLGTLANIHVILIDVKLPQQSHFTIFHCYLTKFDGKFLAYIKSLTLRASFEKNRMQIK